MHRTWLMLVHQIPPKPAYFRVKVWRRLQGLGAVTIKNSVYVLPKSDSAFEDLQWVAREIAEGGGDAVVCEARFVAGLGDAEVEGLFNAARDAAYAEVAEEARRIAARLPAEGEPGEADRTRLATETEHLRRRLSAIAAGDFFGATGRESAEGLVAELESRTRAPVPASHPAGKPAPPRREDFRRRVWVTRRGLHIDRIASAWLIRRFIDREARFRFIAPRGARIRPGEVRFDMFEAEFTHQGDRCTLEVLIERFGLDDPALRPIAEIVHDVDLKERKFDREETDGIERLVAAIAMAHRDDAMRLERGAAVFDDLYELYRRKRR